MIRWSIALAAHRHWPCCGRWSSPAVPRPGTADDPVTFSDYRADFVVDGNGNLDATETITAEFPSGRHGLFRYWDIANLNSPQVRQQPEITSITDGRRPGRLRDAQWESGGRFRVAKIGDPDRYLDWGTHIFEIRYTIPGVLDPGGTGAGKEPSPPPPVRTPPGNAPSVFFWNVIAPSLEQPASTAPTSRSHCPPRSPGRSARSVRRRQGLRRPDGQRDTMTVGASNLAPAHPGHRAGRRRPADPAARRAAVVLQVGPHSGPVGGRSALGRGAAVSPVRWRRLLMYRATVGSRPRSRCSTRRRTGSARCRANTSAPSRCSKNGLTATLFYLADRGLIVAATDEQGQVDDPRHRQAGRVGRRRPGQRRGRLRAQGARRGHGVRRQRQCDSG